MADDNGLTRRLVLRSAVLGGTGVAAGALPTLIPYSDQQAAAADRTSVPPDFTRGSAALEPDKIVMGACQFCNSNCRLRIGMKAGRVVDISGEKDDPVQAGN